MKRNISIPVDETLLAAGRARAALEGIDSESFLDRWLRGYGGTATSGLVFDAVVAELAHIEPGGPFDRQEMNEH